MVELVGGGSGINGAYPANFKKNSDLVHRSNAVPVAAAKLPLDGATDFLSKMEQHITTVSFI